MTGTTPSCAPVYDGSQDGGDPGNGGDATDDEEPTVIRFDILPIAIPAAHAAGLTLLGLLLMGAALVQLRQRG